MLLQFLKVCKEIFNPIFSSIVIFGKLYICKHGVTSFWVLCSCLTSCATSWVSVSLSRIHKLSRVKVGLFISSIIISVRFNVWWFASASTTSVVFATFLRFSGDELSMWWVDVIPTLQPLFWFTNLSVSLPPRIWNTIPPKFMTESHSLLSDVISNS